MSEKLGKWHFWLMFPSFMIMSLVQMWTGLQGMRRRIADYDPALGVQPAQLVITITGFLIAISILIYIINLVRSLRQGEVATGNVWESRSPEWQVSSPMPAHNYTEPLVVVGDPYDYGLPSSPRYVDLGSSATAPQAGD
jgi:cytochrome c oxidase subunit 1